MPSSHNTRKKLTDLKEPIQMQELNRQIEWVWQHILGGLDIKNFSKAGKLQLGELIRTVTGEIYDGQIEEINDDIETLNDNIETINGNIATLAQNVGTLANDLTALALRVSHLETSLVYPISSQEEED